MIRDLALNVVDDAVSLGADEAEVYAESLEGVTIRGGEKIEWFRSWDSIGIGLRVFKERQLGYAYTSDLSHKGIKFLLHEAIDNCRFNAFDPNNELPSPSRMHDEDVSPPEDNVVLPTSEDKIAILGEAERAALQEDERIRSVIATEYGDEKKQVIIISSRGIDCRYETSFVYLRVEALASDGIDTQAAQAFTFAGSANALESQSVGAEAANKALSLLGSDFAPTATLPVVLGPLAAAQLLSQVARMVNGEAVVKSRSLFGELIGELVASNKVTVCDDPLNLEGPATRPFDAEGVPGRKNVVIDRGLLKGFLHNTYTGLRVGSCSTGNARRTSYRATPEVGASNFILQPTSITKAALIGSLREGVYVEELHGLHGANVLSGRFSLGFYGRRIRGGELAEGVSNSTIAGDFRSLLVDIVGVANDLRFLPGTQAPGAPSILIEKVSIGGK